LELERVYISLTGLWVQEQLSQLRFVWVSRFSLHQKSSFYLW